MKGRAMLRRIGRWTAGGMLAVLLLVGASACASSGGSAENVGERDTGDPAKSVVDSKCSLCHSLDRVYAADYTKSEWETTVARMKLNGLVVTDEEYSKIIEFLSN